MSLNMHHNNINTEYVKASAEALFNGTIEGGGGVLMQGNWFWSEEI